MNIKRLLTTIFLSSLIFLNSCDSSIDESFLDSSSESINNSYIEEENVNLHVGGDETNTPNYEYKEDAFFYTFNAHHNGKTIKIIENPQSRLASFSSTTYIYDMKLDLFEKTNEYRQGYTSILYTPDFYFTHTTATEEYNEVLLINHDGKYLVEDIYTDGNSYIPLDGVILATPKNINMNFSYGDEVTFDCEVNSYDYAIVNQDNIRLPFKSRNVYRSESEVVLYDRYYGNRTKTNQYGCEIFFQYDFNSNEFKVKGFRGHKKEIGDLNEDHLNYGGYIPKYGFVISAHQSTTNFELYKQGRKFNIDDSIRFENYSFNYQLPSKTFDTYYLKNPDVRPSNQITIYTSGSKVLDKYGFTNQGRYAAWEFAVSKVAEYDIVTAIDREVGCPKNGYIISCNMEIAEELKKHIKLGTIVKLNDNNKLSVINDDVALVTMTNLEYYINTLLNREAVGKNMLYDYKYDVLSNSITKLIENQTIIGNLNRQNKELSDENKIFANEILMNQYYIEAVKYYEEGYCASTESAFVESRAAWYPPNGASSLKDVTLMLDHYKNCNINLIYVSIFEGTTLFESSYVPYDSNYVGNYGKYGRNNFLGAFVEEAHKRGIEVHGWTTNFFVGYSGEYNKIFDSHPDWQQKYNDGKVDSTDEMTEQNLLYLDQANPEVHEFLITFYKEVFDKFDLDGLHLDYIRYAAGNDVGKPNSTYCPINKGGKLYAKNCLNRTTGYTDYAMADFLKEYGYAPTSNMKELIKDVETYLKWTEYRSNKVTQFVEKIHNEITSVRNIPLSIAIVPEIEHAYLNKMQDWPTWIENGWIDYLNGMFYSTEADRIKITTEEVKETLSTFERKVYQYPGVLACIYYEKPNIHNVYYYEAAKSTNNMGGAFFEVQSIWSYHRAIYSDSNTDVETLFTMGNHRNAAVTPHSSLDKVVDSFINDISQRCDNVYIKYNSMDENGKKQLIEQLNKLNKEDPEVLLTQLIELKSKTNTFASGEAVNRINDYIDVIIEICEIRISSN